MYGPLEIPGLVQPTNQMVLQFLVGDKIMCTKNSDVEVYCENGSLQVLKLLASLFLELGRRVIVLMMY